MNMTKTGRGWRIMRRLTVTATAFVFGLNLFADRVSARFWTDPATDYAIGGYDPVAYFTAGRVRSGVSDFEVSWNGQSWRFANEGNMAVFVENPDLFAPFFDGYGLVSVSRGLPATGNPEVWEIYENRLYLFHTRALRELWRQNRDEILQEARIKWPDVKKITTE